MRAVLLNTPNICQHHDESTRHYLWRVTEILSSVMDIYVLKNSFTVCFSCECMTELSQKRKSSQCKYMTMKMAKTNTAALTDQMVKAALEKIDRDKTKRTFIHIYHNNDFQMAALSTVCQLKHQ